jgi:molybdate transport system regulatory protein
MLSGCNLESRQLTEVGHTPENPCYYAPRGYMHPENRYSLSSRKTKLQYTFRLYLNNAAGERVLGKGGAQILEAIKEYGSIVAAAKNLNMSYKFVCDYLARMKKRLKEPIVVTHRGGADSGRKKGGGGTALTPLAGSLLREFESTQRLIGNTLSSRKKRLTLQTAPSAHRNPRRARRNKKN